MNTRLLMALCAVAETGSIVGAARKLRVSAATLGERIHALETELDAKLVERSGRAVSLTSSGNAILSLADTILADIEELRQRSRPGIGGRLSLGAISTVLTGQLPDTLARITETLPSLDLLVVPGTSEVLFQQVQDGEIDCAIIVEPPFPMPKSLSWTKIRDEPLVLLSHAEDKVQTVRSAIETRPFIRVDRRCWTGRHVSRFISEKNLQTNDILELDAFETIIMLVMRKVGVSLLPDYGLGQLASQSLKMTPLSGGGYFRTIGVVKRTVSPRTHLVDAIADLLLDMGRIEVRQEKMVAGS